MFPDTLESPPLVPEEIDEEAPVPVAEVSMVERVTVSEHYLTVEHVSTRRANPRKKVSEAA